MAIPKGNETVLTEVVGDLFTSKESLVHCVSRCLSMSKGIAVGFRSKFGNVQQLKAQNKGIGDVAVLEFQGRFIYYLITKEKYYHKPTYDSLRASIEALRNHAVAHQVQNLSIPRLGCGLDRLDWEKVKMMLIDVFNGTGIRITVYSLG